jgi:hypothetical protein
VGLFKQKLATCPICDAGIPLNGNKLHHWETHVVQIPQGREGAGGYTWTCTCGPSDTYWPKDFSAAAGLGLHMEQRHAIKLF